MDESNKPRRGRPSAREKILEAALALVQEIGATELTLDAVAERAGVSKGGLLYHFPFKEELLTAANEAIARKLADARNAEALKLPESPSRALKAYVLASVYNSGDNDKITTKMLAAGSMLKESADPIRRYWQQRFPEISEGSGFDRGALVHAATEGLWFMEMLKLSPFSSEQRARLIELILEIADDTSPAPPANALRANVAAGIQGKKGPAGARKKGAH
ncbi:TetR/AcrR family transcriptional regulator [Variovorax sp. H27-G14]|uniref:TetR/AcrR family transcriptional regulator n=1 Tax=Variovorax sp. H27-G14 TaxID=3111914 RepID=UPI0038FBFDEE